MKALRTATLVVLTLTAATGLLATAQPANAQWSYGYGYNGFGGYGYGYGYTYNPTYNYYPLTNYYGTSTGYELYNLGYRITPYGTQYQGSYNSGYDLYNLGYRNGQCCFTGLTRAPGTGPGVLPPVNVNNNPRAGGNAPIVNRTFGNSRQALTTSMFNNSLGRATNSLMAPGIGSSSSAATGVGGAAPVAPAGKQALNFAPPPTPGAGLNNTAPNQSGVRSATGVFKAPPTLGAGSVKSVRVEPTGKPAMMFRALRTPGVREHNKVAPDARAVTPSRAALKVPSVPRADVPRVRIRVKPDHPMPTRTLTRNPNINLPRH